MPRKLAVVLATLCLAATGLAGEDAKPRKPKKPDLDLRASPRIAFSPADVLLTAELKGGDDIEEFYCPEIEWEWGDGGRSVQEADCEPWAEGSTLQRRFSERHTYPQSGLYTVRITLKKSGKTIATRSVSITVRAGFGDMSS